MSNKYYYDKSKTVSMTNVKSVKKLVLGGGFIIFLIINICFPYIHIQ